MTRENGPFSCHEHKYKYNYNCKQLVEQNILTRQKYFLTLVSNFFSRTCIENPYIRIPLENY